MKKPGFLAKLNKQKKLQIVEPSEEVCKAYLEKSDKSIKSSKATSEIESYEDSVALAYYSMYYSLMAVLFKIGVKCENHTAAIILLKKIFGIGNDTITKAKKERVDKQYYVDFSATKEDVDETINQAEEFNSQILEFIETLSQNEIKKYHEKADILIKGNSLIIKTEKAAE